MRAKTDIKTQPHSNFKWVFIPAFLLWSFYINVTGELPIILREPLTAESCIPNEAHAPRVYISIEHEI
jgi:hypothetical protein